MEQMKQRVVPSGKVYRQKFDAEVQLVKALESKDGKLEERHKTVADISLSTRKQLEGIPLVRRSQTAGGGMPGRQRTWAEGLPNESSIENPVLYKYYSDEIREHFREPESNLASKEVRGLPDVLNPAKEGSNIIERIAESRKTRHEAALEDMHQELGVISSETEPKVEEAAEALLQKLNGNDASISELMASIDEDEKLLVYTLSDLEELWLEAASQSEHRQTWIKELDDTLIDIEKNRMTKIREVFQSYAENLESIAHLMAPDLSRLLDKESQNLNQTVLSNRRAYADLYSRLMMADIEREKHLHTYWKKQVEEWKALNTKVAVESFKSYMESEVVLNPVSTRSVVDEWQKDQDNLNTRRLDLVNSLREMKPPASTKTAVYQWNQKITEVSKDIDQLNQRYFNTLYVEYEKVCQECLAEVERIKDDLLARGICSEVTAQKVINESCLPVVGERQTYFEKMLEKMDKNLEEHNAHVLQTLKSLFKFAQGAAHVWDVHEVGLAKQERTLLERLEECRHKHDNENQEKEANLDIIMDRMRQDASENTLKESLKKALAMLDKIKDGYDLFHQQQKDIVGLYPEMVEEELRSYDEAVCKFFALDRGNKQDGESVPREESAKKKKSKKSKRPSSRASSRASDCSSKAESPLPAAVSEILSTAKGSKFFVLTEAGEHGIPAEAEDKPNESKTKIPSPQPNEESTDAENVMLTEVPDQQEELRKSFQPDPLDKVNVPDDLIIDVKKMIRMNFLDHLDDWTEQAVDRAQSVVAAKLEELNSELDLRLHLHQPRPRRAELDVHNVRAAELLMHSERVTRHTKGINQSLTDLKQQFSDMTEEHNTLSNKFRDDIEALEEVFINATKSSKIVALSNQLQVEKEKFMTVIRTSLRQFRQQLDETLQMLRESNARFIKSFKLFSDGGNFCPEEIEEYRKRLEKMSQKIDGAEGFVMSDLEGMESKRLEQATKISNEFEDRFKHHMIDLIFMEKIARWLTNTQVKIKSEVADSNTQAQKLSQYLIDLERRIDACEHPNLDKEEVSPTQLYDSLTGIFEAFQNRSSYLNCLKNTAPRPPSGAMQGAPGMSLSSVATSIKMISQTTKVGFAPGSDIPPVSRAGKQPSEDPTVGVIKNILKTQKAHFDPNAELDSDQVNVAGQPSHGKADRHSAKRRPSVITSNVREDGLRPKSKSPIKGGNHLNPLAVAGSDAKRIPSGALPFDSLNVVRNITSAQRVSPYPTHKDWILVKLFGDSVELVIMQSNPRRISKGNKVEKKYMLFGTERDDGQPEENYFLAKIKQLLKETLEGLLSAADIYYRQKGNRPVTRPQALQENFETCAETVSQKLQSYYTQADEYHNQCLQEFRNQLTRLEESVSRVPSCVIKELVTKAISGLREERKLHDEGCTKQLHKLDAQRYEHKNDLRPTLGHPNQKTELALLCEQEETRNQEYLDCVQKHSGALKELVVQRSKGFVENLAKVSEDILLQFDNLLVVDDVERGRVPPTKYSTSELIRRKNAGQPLEDKEDKNALPRGKNTWEGLPKKEMVLPTQESDKEKSNVKEKSQKTEKAGKTQTTASVTTAKTTLGHSATVKSRDSAYKIFKGHFAQLLSSIEDETSKQMVAEHRWTDSWLTSVQKVKDLY